MLFYLDKDYLQCLHKVYLHTLYLHKNYFQCLCTFFGGFFYLGFTALSRIFCLYCANCSSKVAENRRIQGKPTWPSVSRAWLSHMWLEQGSNHSSEKPKLVYLHTVYLHRLFPSVTDSWQTIFVFLIVAVLFLICCFKWPPPPLTAIHFHLSSSLFFFFFFFSFNLSFLSPAFFSLISDICLQFIFYFFVLYSLVLFFRFYFFWLVSSLYIAIHFSPLLSLFCQFW